MSEKGQNGMGYGFLDRIKMIVCKLFGHTVPIKDSWVYDGRTHCTCHVCGKIISKRVEDQ